MRYYVIAGEASGDLHGGNLLAALKKKDPDAEIRCWGGEHMAAAGAEIVKHYRDLAFMGFVEVVKHLGTVLKNISFCKKDILAFQPDVVVFIDYPGFNMRIARWAKSRKFKTVYYISPQVWAWKEGRVRDLKRDIDKMLVILPFEVGFYKNWSFPVIYTGHPLVEVIRKERETVPIKPLSEKPLIALLPGSRRQEIAAKLPEMLKMVSHFPDYQFIVACAPGIPGSFYDAYTHSHPNILLASGQTYNILKQSRAALVTSGTATLETALFHVPQIVCYKGNPFSYWLAKKLIKVKYISLVNLIMNKEVVPELIQQELNEKRLKQELSRLLYDEAYLDQLEENYNILWQQLGDIPASETAAEEIFALASEQ